MTDGALNNQPLPTNVVVSLRGDFDNNVGAMEVIPVVLAKRGFRITGGGKTKDGGMITATSTKRTESTTTREALEASLREGFEEYKINPTGLVVEL